MTRPSTGLDYCSDLTNRHVRKDRVVNRKVAGPFRLLHLLSSEPPPVKVGFGDVTLEIQYRATLLGEAFGGAFDLMNISPSGRLKSRREFVRRGVAGQIPPKVLLPLREATGVGAISIAAVVLPRAE